MNTRLSLAARRTAGAGVTATVLFGSFAAAPWAHATTSAAVTGFRPAYGPAGTTVTIHESGFDASQPITVAFGSSAQEAGTWTGTDQLTAPVPGDATTGPVTLTQLTTTATSTKKFVVTLPATATLSTRPRHVTWPRAVTVTATVTDAGGPVPDHWGHLQARKRGASNWWTVKSVHPRKTDSHGRVSFRVVPSQAEQFRVDFPASHYDLAVTTRPSATISVIPRVTLTVAQNIPQLTTVPVTGTVGPQRNGTVKVQLAHGKRWQTVATPWVRRGAFSTHISFGRLGAVKLRAVRPADGARRTGTSAVSVAQVVHRSLKQGDSGPDVATLQRRLRRLHYDVGAVNGSYGFDTFHAVTAFQKVQGLADDGAVGLQTWNALAHPKRLHLRHPLPGVTAVEVNLARQVIIIAKDGKIWRIIDSSTAGGYYYTNSAGQSEKAITPTGHFTIQYKQDGWQHSSLGYLYRPAYFTNTGYAIHGETEVPPYPASHGCVRMTVPAMDRYANTFYVGESVWIYGNPPPGHA